MTDGSDSQAPGRHEHLGLVAGTDSSGRPVREAIPASALDDDVFEVLGTPALVYGFAAGDVIQVTPDDSFQVLRRGGTLAVRAFPADAFTAEDVQRLTDAFLPLGGLVEAPGDRRFIVATVPATAGFKAVEAVMTPWLAEIPDALWEYGNVYAADGSPLNWWQVA